MRRIKQASTGTCYLCGKSVSQTGATRHLAGCILEHDVQEGKRVRDMFVEIKRHATPNSRRICR